MPAGEYAFTNLDTAAAVIFREKEGVCYGRYLVFSLNRYIIFKRSDSIMSEKKENLTPVSMFAITANLINHIQHSVHEQLGDQGLRALEQGIHNFIDEQVEMIDAAPRKYDIKENAIFNHEKLLDSNKVEQTYKNYIAAQEKAGISQPISIYGLMAKVFAHMAKVVVDSYGKHGEDVIMNGVRAFGEERGRNIAKRAFSMGKPSTLENYLPHYDMGRSDLFEYVTIYHPGEIEQTFTKCAFGEQWKKDGMKEYGILYCHMIDPAIAKGYNPNFVVVHDEYVLREGCCHFLFQSKENKH